MFLATQHTGSATLTPLQAMPLPHYAWQRLAQQIAAEDVMLPVSADELRKRWQAGQAQIAIDGEQIVSYTSVKPTFGSLEREHIAALSRGRVQLPAVDLYESATGWTHPLWRGMGLGYELRVHLYGGLHKHSLIYSATRSAGAPRLLYKLGLRVVAWEAVPFLSSVKGWFDAGRRYTHNKGWHPSVPPYNGDSLNPATAEHDWTSAMHFWVSNIEMALALDTAYESAVLDLTRWRGLLADILRPITVSNMALQSSQSDTILHDS